MKKNLTAFVIGYGSIGKRHVKNLLLKKNIDIIVLTQVKNLKSNKRCTFYDSFSKCLEQNPDFAIISNDTNRHVDVALKLAKNGINMLIEKPLSNSLLHVDELLRIVKTKKIITMMGCNLRFHPCIQKIKELIDSKKIGDIISFQIENGSYLPDWHKNEDFRQSYASRKDKGGGVTLTCIHEIDYLYWFLGMPSEIFAITGIFSNLMIDVDDLSLILLKFDTKVGTIHLDYFQQPSFRGCKIMGTHGTIIWNIDENIVKKFDIKKKKWINVLNVNSFNINQTYLDEIDHFLKCMQNKKSTINSLEEGIDILKISLTALKSSKQRRMLKI